MNKLQIYLEKNHIEAAKMNTAITESFFTPDRVKVQVYANMVDRAGQTYPEFRLVKIDCISLNVPPISLSNVPGISE